jgi:glycopeptide antibiotics resistance protein
VSVTCTVAFVWLQVVGILSYWGRGFGYRVKFIGYVRVVILVLYLPLYFFIKCPWAVDQKHLEGFEMWCWRRMEKII